MPEPSPDAPRFVTDEPGLDPVSGRPWGEETPAKRVATYTLLAVVCLAATVYLAYSGPGAGRGAVGVVLGPVVAGVFAVRAWLAVRELRGLNRSQGPRPIE